MKKTIDVCIIPLYKTNIDLYNAAFSKYQMDMHTLDMVYLVSDLDKLSRHYNIGNISVFGGEISLVSELYFDMLYRALKLYTNDISIMTNFLYLNKSMINSCKTIDVVYNFYENDSIKKAVLNNIKAATKTDININLKVINNLNEDDIYALFKEISQTGISSIEFLKKMGNDKVLEKQFSNKVFDFKGVSNLFNKEACYIVPNGNFARANETNPVSFQEYCKIEDFLNK